MKQSSQAKDTAAIRAMLKSWAKALNARNLAGLTANYHKDVVFFDVKPPHRLSGIKAYQKMWAKCLPYFPKKIKSSYKNLQIFVQGGHAIAHGLHCIVPLSDLKHPCGELWFRFTICYKKVKGKWLVFHEHVSAPFNPMTERVVTGLTR